MGKTGLSVSFCIAYVIRGKISEDDIAEIIAGTRCETPENWDEVIKVYRETYWRDDPDSGKAVIRRLLADGKVSQPRVAGEEAPNIAGGHWR